MIWRTESPTEPGWYWFRWRPDAHCVADLEHPPKWRTIIVRLKQSSPSDGVTSPSYLRIESINGGPYGSDREWCGPIEEPKP